MYSCFIDNNKLNVTIESSYFRNNNGINGGAIYINSEILEKQNKIFSIKDTIFTDNEAKNMGGAIYVSCNELNFKNIENTTFLYNSAYAGGAIYINNTNIILSQENKNTFINNTAESHGNNYASNPYKITLITDLNDLTITSGESKYLKFQLLDYFNNTVKDFSKLYSNLILQVINNNNNNKNNKEKCK